MSPENPHARGARSELHHAEHQRPLLEGSGHQRIRLDCETERDDSDGEHCIDEVEEQGRAEAKPGQPLPERRTDTEDTCIYSLHVKEPCKCSAYIDSK